MSLKAKLEAVIYASEEPVTLAQLAVLFAAEALEYKAEREASTTEAVNESLPLIMDGTEEIPVEETGEEASFAAEAEAATEPVAEETAEADSEASSETSSEAEPEAEAAAKSAEPVAETVEEPVDLSAEAKQAARQRDREVKAVLREILDELIASYESDDGRGVEIREIAGGYRMATKPECHDAVRMFVKSLKPPLKLSLPALETLAVIAYKQPITAPEVSEIRGVESGGVLGSLMARKLIATAGRKQVIGRPMLYKTTKEFLLRFGLKDTSELPSMEEFEKIAAIEIEEMEPETNDAPAEPAKAEPETELISETQEESEGAETAQVQLGASNTSYSEEPSQQAEIEAVPDAPKENEQDSGESASEEDSSEEIQSEAEEIR